MNKKLHLIILILLSFAVFMFNSCIGISADIQIQRDGSGRISLEYKFSRMAEIIGRLDGNDKQHIIPTGRLDFERTVSRIEGMRLVSFSSSEDTKNIINRVILEFNNTEALLKFLDPSGKRAKLSQENNLNKLYILLNEPVSSDINPDLMNLMQQVSEDYKISIRFSAAGAKDTSITFTNGTGEAIISPVQAKVVSENIRNNVKKVSMSIDTAEILTLNEGLGVNFIW
jgi:hypothetical protein